MIKRAERMLREDGRNFPAADLLPIKRQDLDIPWIVTAEDGHKLAFVIVDLRFDADFESLAANGAILLHHPGRFQSEIGDAIEEVARINTAEWACEASAIVVTRPR